jgi:hypothetical protein
MNPSNQKKKKPNRQDSIKLTIKSYDQKNKNTSETMREEDEADDKATVEAVRTEATRAREPFMFSLWVFSINLRDLIEEEIFKLLTGEIRRGVLTRSRPAVEIMVF